MLPQQPGQEAGENALNQSAAPEESTRPAETTDVFAGLEDMNDGGAAE